MKFNFYFFMSKYSFKDNVKNRNCLLLMNLFLRTYVIIKRESDIMDPFKFFRKNRDSFSKYTNELANKKEIINKQFVDYDYPDNEIMAFSKEVIDTNDEENVAKFKHNLNVIKRQVLNDGKALKFYLIREDDDLPNNWQWEVLSKDTKLENVSFALTSEIRESIAMAEYQKKYGKDNQFCGDILGNDEEEEYNKVLYNLDQNLGKVKMPAHFRSTKHFTINTPLENTGEYNSVMAERNFIIIDTMTNFLDSNYGYSISNRDAYLDVSHESLPISGTAIVLINEAKYKKILENERFARQLSERKVVLYKGDTQVAINMLLSELGAMPFRVGTRYLDYDPKVDEIMTNALQKVASDNDLLYDKSHGGIKKGHFTSQYDDTNNDYEYSMLTFYNFLLKKFSDRGLTLQILESKDYFKIKEFVEKVGVSEILKVIESYNKITEYDFLVRNSKYCKEHQTISLDIHKLFTSTVNNLNFYFSKEHNLSLEDEQKLNDLIITFFQSLDIKKEIKAAKEINDFLEQRWNLEVSPKEDIAIVNGMRL